jgi:hypothetical protein
LSPVEEIVNKDVENTSDAKGSEQKRSSLERIVKTQTARELTKKTPSISSHGSCLMGLWGGSSCQYFTASGIYC